MAHAIVYTAVGGPEVLTLVEIPSLQPEAVVRVEAAGVNPIDARQSSSFRPLPPIGEPRRVGYDGAGVVTAVGVGVTAISVGDRVAIRDTPGTYATALSVPVANLADARLGDLRRGRGAGHPADTAYQSPRSLGVTDGDVLLVHAGSGAIGRPPCSSPWTGARPSSPPGAPASHKRLRELGAIPVAYSEELEERVRARYRRSRRRWSRRGDRHVPRARAGQFADRP